MLLLAFAPLVPSPELDLFVLNLDEAALLFGRLGAALSGPTPGSHRIGDFDDIYDAKHWYREPYDDRYWLQR
jgi:hypothetical protein